MMNREDLVFYSQGIRCCARLYVPAVADSKPPIVIMAHGFAAEQDFRLIPFAERFVCKGMAVMTFDYRNFGASGGEPRNLVDPGRHVEDWLAAIGFARRLDRVDGSRIGLWGTSFSGGHVLVAAARDGNVKAVVSQVPFVDGLATMKSLKPMHGVTALVHGLLDLLGSIVGRTHYVPVVSEPDRFGLMNTPESKPGYLALVPEGSRWKNQAPARVVLTLAGYRPVNYAARISCPVLMICAEKDSLIRAEHVRKCAAKIRSCAVETLPVGHFDVYFGQWFEKAAEKETEFLAGLLLVSA